MGETIMLVTATVEDRVPPWLKGQGQGWVTAEYGMLPRSGRQRNQRDTQRPNARSMEIQRLIGRSMRSVVDLKKLGERTITLDCDAIQADGGTRTASITAAQVALEDAFAWMMEKRMLDRVPMTESIAAVSVGVVNGVELLDLCYAAEAEPFEEEQFAKLLGLGKRGIKQLFEFQREALAL
jgi:ribonuclease PH